MRRFTAPSTPADAIEQMRNLERKLQRFNSLSQLKEGADLEDIRARVNLILTTLQAITKDGVVGRVG